MHALIDTDIFCYAHGAAVDEDKNPLPWPLVKARIDAQLDSILNATQATSWQGYLTGPGNFRDKIATIKPYKGTRDRADRPFWYQGVYNYLRDERGCKVIQGMEADDAIAIASDKTKDSWEATTIICSKDKDLRQVHGWHYDWPTNQSKQEEIFWVSEKGAWKSFFKQCLIGDPVDNILGLYGIGPKSSCVDQLNDVADEVEMFSIVKREYVRRFGAYWKLFLEETGTLLWLLRFEGDSFKDRLEWLLENEYQRRIQPNGDNSSPTKSSGVEQTIMHLEWDTSTSRT